mmetsp:Transcript_27715/g.66798  ORF Transcript_27715/g.66798 Transcript_27715/m.66798 type:complete len:208 (+) Transcript_27715:438-1061(+)
MLLRAASTPYEQRIAQMSFDMRRLWSTFSSFHISSKLIPAVWRHRPRPSSSLMKASSIFFLDRTSTFRAACSTNPTMRSARADGSTLNGARWIVFVLESTRNSSLEEKKLVALGRSSPSSSLTFNARSPSSECLPPSSSSWSSSTSSYVSSCFRDAMTPSSASTSSLSSPSSSSSCLSNGSSCSLVSFFAPIPSSPSSPSNLVDLWT